MRFREMVCKGVLLVIGFVSIAGMLSMTYVVLCKIYWGSNEVKMEMYKQGVSAAYLDHFGQKTPYMKMLDKRMGDHVRAVEWRNNSLVFEWWRHATYAEPHNNYKYGMGMQLHMSSTSTAKAGQWYSVKPIYGADK